MCRRQAPIVAKNIGGLQHTQRKCVPSAIATGCGADSALLLLRSGNGIGSAVADDAAARRRAATGDESFATVPSERWSVRLRRVILRAN